MKKIIKRLGHFFARRKLKRDLLNRRVLRATVPFDEAKKIGVLFVAHQEEDLRIAHDFINDLSKKGKEVEYIGLILIKDYRKKHKDLEKDPHYIFESDFDFFHRPKRTLIDHFYKSEFDLLLSLNYTHQFSIDYISSLSRATLRVGKYHFNNVNAYDFMIDDKGTDLGNYIKQLTNYINQLKK